MKRPMILDIHGSQPVQPVNTQKSIHNQETNSDWVVCKAFAVTDKQIETIADGLRKAGIGFIHYNQLKRQLNLMYIKSRVWEIKNGKYTGRYRELECVR